MSLILDRVSYTYPGSGHGLREISLQVDKGDLLAVIGPSGSGKSTLLKLISGLVTDHAGKIFLSGEDLAGKPVHRRDIGMVFQNYALFPHLSVADNVAYGLKMRGVSAPERRRRAHGLLDLMGLGTYADTSVARLSGGQQQRVALARALAIDPKALLLDEPLAALDASIRGFLRDQIREIQQRFQATTVLVTHDQEEALSMADKVAVLKDGRLLQLATPQMLYQAPASKDVAEFVGRSTILPATVCAHNCIDVGFAMLSTPTGQRRPGQKLFALIRPEHFQTEPAPDAANCLVGKSGAARYLGAVYRFDFHIEGAPQPMLIESTRVGMNTISIAPEHVCLLDH